MASFAWIFATGADLWNSQIYRASKEFKDQPIYSLIGPITAAPVMMIPEQI